MGERRRKKPTLPVNRADLTCRVEQEEHGKPDVLPTERQGIKEAGKPQGDLKEQRAGESGKSESLLVMSGIGQPRGRDTQHESVQTSTRSFVTRELEKPDKGEKADESREIGLCAPPQGSRLECLEWRKVSRNVRRLQVRIVKVTQ
jgi:hypothetical protein